MNTDQRPELTNQNLFSEKGIGFRTDNDEWRKNHRELLLQSFDDDIEAVRVVEIIGKAARALDDIHDMSFPVVGIGMSELIETLIFELPLNKFYQKHCEKITTFLTVAMSCWNHSNEVEEKFRRGRDTCKEDCKLISHSYVWRNTINELVGMLIFLKKMDLMTEDGFAASNAIEYCRTYASIKMRMFRELYCQGTETCGEYFKEHMRGYDQSR